MSSSQIQTLLAPPDLGRSQDQATLFVNSRYNNLEELDELEVNVRHAHDHDADLQSRLAISNSKIYKLVSQSRALAETHLNTAQELSLLRHSLADELLLLSQELEPSFSREGNSTTLLVDLETLHRSLKELQNIKSYVQIIHHALTLSEAAAQKPTQLSVVSLASLAEYQSLQDFVSRVSRTCSQEENISGEGTLNLVSLLERVRDKTWLRIKDAWSILLLKAAEKLQWPMPVDYASANPADRAAFESAFINLLELQTMGESIRSQISPISSETGLYPIEALVQPISLRFKYHFEGTRQTNKLDKPEWYFTHILNVVHDHRPFMESVVQSLLSSTVYRDVNAWCEFAMLLFPLISRKLKRTIPALLPHPSLLAHTIYQALAFDAALIEEGFEISSTSAKKDEEWYGASDMILNRQEWFDAWLEGERQFAMGQYNDIISSSDAWLIADEVSEDVSTGRDLKSTTSARRVKALVEQITDRYSLLPNFTQRTRFLISVQLPILEYYHGRICSSLDAFETLSSAFVRAVPGALGVHLGGKEENRANADTRSLISGVEGVQRLCKALLSARYLQLALEGWGEEVFFLELWTEINRRVSLRARAEENPSLPDPSGEEVDAPPETIFQEICGLYERVTDRAEDMIVQQVCGEVEGALKVHFAAATSTRSNSDYNDGIALSPTLLPPITLLSSHLKLLISVLPHTLVTTLYRRITSRLAEHILQRQIMYRGQVALREGKEILAESELWVETCRATLQGSMSGYRNRIDAPWLGLIQAARLISAEGAAWEKVVDITFGPVADEQWREEMEGLLGTSDIGREEAQRLLNIREDCHR